MTARGVRKALPQRVELAEQEQVEPRHLLREERVVEERELGVEEREEARVEREHLELSRRSVVSACSSIRSQL